MFEKIANSWNLAKECWRVLMLDKEMLMFPVLSTLATILVFGLIAYPLWASGYFNETEMVQINLNEIFSLATFLKYALLTIIPTYLTYVIMTFFNSGLVTCAFIRLSGGDPILKDGFQIALRRLPQILAWSVLAASVGLLLRMIKGRNNFFRSLFGGVLDLGWRIASFVVIPVIVAEGKGPIESLKRSGHLIRKNWGEALTLEIGLSVLVVPAMVPVFLLFGLSSYVGETMPIAGLFLSVIAVLMIFLILSVISTLDAIAKAALYMTSSGNQKLVNFNQETLDKMVKHKQVQTPAWV